MRVVIEVPEDAEFIDIPAHLQGVFESCGYKRVDNLSPIDRLRAYRVPDNVVDIDCAQT